MRLYNNEDNDHKNKMAPISLGTILMPYIKAHGKQQPNTAIKVHEQVEQATKRNQRPALTDSPNCSNVRLIVKFDWSSITQASP